MTKVLNCTLVTNDPGVELHPGPTSSQSLLKYTKEESNIVRSIKELNTVIARLSSHRFYNKTCMDLQLKPKTLYREIKIAHTPAKPNPKLLTKLKTLQNSYTLEAMSTYNEHYTEVIASCNSKKSELVEQLRSKCKADRFVSFKCIIDNYKQLRLKRSVTWWTDYQRLMMHGSPNLA